MARYRVYLWEWDPVNGEYKYRDYRGEVVIARDEEDLWDKLEKRLLEYKKEAENSGWNCDLTANGELYCVDEEGNESVVSYDVEEIG